MCMCICIYLLYIYILDIYAENYVKIIKYGTINTETSDRYRKM